VPYATVADVLARAGKVAPAWTATSTPGLSDVDLFISRRASEIDATLLGLGYAAPLSGVPGDALVSLNAAGALLLLLSGTFPNKEGPAAAASLLDEVRTEWRQGMDALRAGTHPSTMAAEQQASETGSSPSADDYWSANGVEDELVIERGMTF
jgi:hypothetical protein